MMNDYQEKKTNTSYDMELTQSVSQQVSASASQKQPMWTEAAMGDQVPTRLVLPMSQSETQEEQSDGQIAPTSASVPIIPNAQTILCPVAVPAKKQIECNCPLSTPVAGTLPPKKEDAQLPVLNEDRFGGDTDVAAFAKDLAVCHASRIVQDEVDKRYKEAKAQAKKSAEAQSKIDTVKSIEDAIAVLEDKNKSTVVKARREATAQALRDAQQKIREAMAAVDKPDVALVQTELQTKLEEELATDFKLTMQGAIARFGTGWKARMNSQLMKGRVRLEKELKVKPKVQKGETPPPQRPLEEIEAEIEACLAQKRCEQSNWAENQLEGIKRGWMVGKREEVNFKTIKQDVKGLGKDFVPPREVPKQERVQIPDNLKTDENMPGVAPEVVAFLLELQKLEPTFKVGNYAGHGGGVWAGKGYSLDLFLSGKNAAKDDRGFWLHNVAVRFLLNLDKAAKSMSAQWRVLYNDFGVAEEVNRTTGVRNVTFMGSPLEGKNLNWHGPDPLILHFHLDIAPRVSRPIVL